MCVYVIFIGCVVVTNKICFCVSLSFFCRVVGGFETLTDMENVESDPKTDKPKVGISDIYFLNWLKCNLILL